MRIFIQSNKNSRILSLTLPSRPASSALVAAKKHPPGNTCRSRYAYAGLLSALAGIVGLTALLRLRRASSTRTGCKPSYSTG